MRLVSIFVLHRYRAPQTWEFGEIAHAIVAGHGYSGRLPNGIYVPSAYMPPLYTYVLVALWKIVGESARAYLLLEILQAALGALLVLVLYRLARLLFSPAVALTAAGIAAIWPAFIYLCNEFHSINVYILLGMVAVYYLVRYIEVSRSWKDAVCLGLSMGLLLLCRAEAVALLFLYAGIMIWRCGRAALLPALSLMAIAFLCLAPWTLRNMRALGHPVLVATSGGENLWIGHNPRALGDATYKDDYLSPDQQKTIARLLGPPDTAVLVDRQMEAFAIEYARTHPLREAQLFARKLFFFLAFDPTHPKGSRISYWGPSMLLLLFALHGAWLRGRLLPRSDLPLTATFLFGLFVSTAVFALPRYRLAVDPILVLFAANSLVHLRCWLRSRSASSASPAVASSAWRSSRLTYNRSMRFE